MAKLSPSQEIIVANATNGILDVRTQRAFIASLETVNPGVATTTSSGLVLKAATVANAAAALPAAAPAGGVGAAAGGWDTAANRDAAIATINGLRTAVSELQTQLNSVISSMRAAGQIV